MTTGPPWVLNLVTLTITLPAEVAAQIAQRAAEPEPVEVRWPPPGQAPPAEP